MKHPSSPRARRRSPYALGTTKRSFNAGPLRVTVHLGPQHLSARIAEPFELADEHAAEAVLTPTPNASAMAEFIPAGALAQKAKQLDDGLRAAVELLLQRGAGRLPARRWLLARWTDAVLGAPGANGDAALTLAAACELGGIEARIPRHLRQAVKQRVLSFRGDPHRSKPLGFYTWSDELTRAFQQDRMLQTPLTQKGAVASLAASLSGDARLRAAYEAHLALNAAMAGPTKRPDLRRALSASAAPGEPLSIFPPSDSPESALIRAWAATGDAPPGDVLSEVVRSIRARRPDAAPPRDDWRAYTAWALEPLLVPNATPERRRLLTGAGYDEYLEQLFRAAYALCRETHIKDEEEEEEAEEEDDDDVRRGVPITIAPKLTTDPLPTHYLRRALAYRRLREILADVFGAELSAVARQTPEGPGALSLADELSGIESLFLGAAATAWRELGAVPERAVPDWPGGESAAAARRFQSFRRGVARDPDVARDARMMVPVSHDPEGGLTRVWALLGWAEREAVFSFLAPPRVSAKYLDPAIKRSPHLLPTYLATHKRVAYPVVVEMQVRELLDRAAFRRLCDREKTAPAIVARLSRSA